MKHWSHNSHTLLTLATAEAYRIQVSLVSQSPTASASMLGVYLFMELGVVDGGDVPYCVPPQKLHVHKHLLDCSEWGRGGKGGVFLQQGSLYQGVRIWVTSTDILLTAATSTL